MENGLLINVVEIGGSLDHVNFILGKKTNTVWLAWSFNEEAQFMNGFLSMIKNNTNLIVLLVSIIIIIIFV